ncbi:MAG: glucose 1-dehydrogenase [Acetobacteraceae bacterium]|nr:MAG: glucose 1-dehydrogenase [Acetobacteraceae bacterium]
MQPHPDHGETTWVGSGRLQGRVALITGADSGIGRAVAIAYAREGADVALCYLNETEDAADTAKLIEDEGQSCISIAADLSDPEECHRVVQQVVKDWGRIDVLVNNAAHQTVCETFEDLTRKEWDKTFAVNINAVFHLSQAAVPHMGAGSSIINTASINSDKPNPSLLAYATTKGAIQNFTAGLAQLLAERGIRVNCVAPGPVWTPLIPASMPAEKVAKFGQDTPMKRPAQPVELASAYVMLAEPMSSYISGATIAVTGGTPML